jgi:hypothetical protein
LPMNCVNKGYNIFRPLIGHEYHCRMHCEQGTWRHVCVIPMDLIPKWRLRLSHVSVLISELPTRICPHLQALCSDIRAW